VTFVVPRAFAFSEPVPVEVRVDARTDRGVGTPTVRIVYGKSTSGRPVQEVVSCRDDGTNGDSAARDRLWQCRGELETAGAARLVLVDGAGGESERVLDELAIKLLPGRTLRWSWSARPTAWPANRLAATKGGPMDGKTSSGVAASLTAFAEGSGGPSGSAPGAGGGMPDAPGESAGEGPAGPGGRDRNRLTRRISLPISYQSAVRTAMLPSTLVTPTWQALLAIPGALLALGLSRWILRAGLIAALRAGRSAGPG
jgi:hypothetical protein